MEALGDWVEGTEWYWGTRVETTVGKDLLQLIKIKKINSYCMFMLSHMQSIQMTCHGCVGGNLRQKASQDHFIYLIPPLFFWLPLWTFGIFWNYQKFQGQQLSLFRLERRTCRRPKPPWMGPTEPPERRKQSTQRGQRMARIKVRQRTTRDLPSLAMTCRDPVLLHHSCRMLQKYN